MGANGGGGVVGVLCMELLCAVRGLGRGLGKSKESDVKERSTGRR